MNPMIARTTGRKGSMQCCSKGQVATESLLVLSFLFLILVPLLVFVFSTFSSESWKLDAQQANAAVRRMTGIANQLALGGDGTFTTEAVFLPSSAKEIKVSGREITIIIDAKEFGLIEQTAVADIPFMLNAVSDWKNIKGMNVITLTVAEGRVSLTRQQ